MNTQEILQKFKDHPYMVRMGAKKLAKRLKTTVEKIREARRLYHSSSKGEKKVKILILDIETSPMKAWVWRRWKENIYLEQTIQEWFMLSWSAKWLGEESFGFVLTPEEVSNEDDRRILLELYNVLNEADIVIAHNGNKFDIPKINTRFLLNNIPSPSPYRQIDTLDIVKKQFGFSSNSLDALSTFFGYDNKDPHDFMLWKSCLEGDEEALERLLKYNKKDVEILEKVYLKLRPWIKNHPNVNVIAQEGICSHCGSNSVTELQGVYYNTQHYKYPVYRCNKCNALSRSKIRLSKKQEFTSF